MTSQDHTLHDAFEQFQRHNRLRGLSKQTIDWYDRFAKPFFTYIGDVPFESITRADIENYVLSLMDQDQKYLDHPCHQPQKGGLSRSTIHGRQRVLRRFFNWAVEAGLLQPEDNPMLGVQAIALPAQQPRAITEDNLRALLEAAHG